MPSTSALSSLTAPPPPSSHPNTMMTPWRCCRGLPSEAYPELTVKGTVRLRALAQGRRKTSTLESLILGMSFILLSLDIPRTETNSCLTAAFEDSVRMRVKAVRCPVQGLQGTEQSPAQQGSSLGLPLPQGHQGILCYKLEFHLGPQAHPCHRAPKKAHTHTYSLKTQLLPTGANTTSP